MFHCFILSAVAAQKSSGKQTVQHSPRIKVTHSIIFLKRVQTKFADTHTKQMPNGSRQIHREKKKWRKRGNIEACGKVFMVIYLTVLHVCVCACVCLIFYSVEKQSGAGMSIIFRNAIIAHNTRTRTQQTYLFGYNRNKKLTFSMDIYPSIHVYVYHRISSIFPFAYRVLR